MDEREGGAMFSPDRRYRYRLTRRVGEGERTVTFVMLNPSKADESQDDPTIRKCRGFAQRWGFGWMHAVNLSPFMATRPEDLARNLPEPPEVQQCNIRAIRETVAGADLIVAAYGNHAGRFAKIAGAHDRVGGLTRSLRNSGNKLHCLGVTAKGFPCHPGRLAYNTALEEYER